ncbi:MAG: hypothetical protein M3Q56_12340 [Bacteroidota bacterium]|nr:hypothetical protein [Bacteroidota bacterium]
MKNLSLFILSFLLMGIFVPADAQYFGRNKPKYKELDFKILQTVHFDIYYYDLDSLKIREVGSWFETWYKMHQAILRDTFTQRNPVILYNNHADFQQTYAIGGNIDAGTGGVTEGLRNRVILPLAITNEQSFHVIGHELVHAFQYHMILQGDSTNIESLGNYPLWVIEGLAEYLSVGRRDPHTAMWMRDAVQRKDIPALKKMDQSKYFPYRYGQAFWSFFSGFFGDEKIKPFFMAIGQYGFDQACREVLQIRSDTLSNLWQRTMNQYYADQIKGQQKTKQGKKIIDDDNAGRINISPALSPNGKYLAFLSEKDLFTIDLFLADANSGKVIRKLYSTAKEGHIDQLNAIESAGTWSPDSKKFAFVAFKKGQSVLIIIDAETGKTSEEILLSNLYYFTHPSWSPNGNKMVLSGIQNGQTDLYLLDLKTLKAEKLSDDIYAEIQADWSPDGSKIVFSTDQLCMENGRVDGKWKMNLAILDLNTSKVTQLDLFSKANSFNPQFNHESDLIFISDYDGVRNIYKYKIDSNITYRISDVINGVSSLTPYGPAISVSQKRDRILYSYYSDNSFQIYQASTDRLDQTLVDKNFVVDPSVAVLPFENVRKTDIVNEQIRRLDEIQLVDSSRIQKYRPEFSLTYIGASGGTSYGSSFRTGLGLAGGVDMLFSDIIGEHQLYSGLSLNGEIVDVAGAVTYINQSKRLPWGLGISHFPSRYFNFTPGFEFHTYQDQNGNTFEAITDTTEVLRIFEDQASAFIHYPISVTQRFEGGAGFSYRFFRLDQIVDYYGDQNRFSYITSNKDKISLGNSVNIGPYQIQKGMVYNAFLGWVGDNSYFGLTSPLLGYRYRVSIEQNFGLYNYFANTLDGRKYFWLKPVGIAVRGMHFARYGKDANAFYPTLLGEYGLMHGFGYGHLDELRSRHGIEYEQISGSKIALGSLELRLPLFGPKRFALIPFEFLPMELNFFLDGGVAWDDYSDFNSDIEFVKPLPVFSTGIGLRVNVLGALILEPYFAWPLEKNSKAYFGFNLLPGW